MPMFKKHMYLKGTEIYKL